MSHQQKKKNPPVGKTPQNVVKRIREVSPKNARTKSGLGFFCAICPGNVGDYKGVVSGRMNGC